MLGIITSLFKVDGRIPWMTILVSIAIGAAIGIGYIMVARPAFVNIPVSFTKKKNVPVVEMFQKQTSEPMVARRINVPVVHQYDDDEESDEDDKQDTKFDAMRNFQMQAKFAPRPLVEQVQQKRKAYVNDDEEEFETEDEQPQSM